MFLARLTPLHMVQEAHLQQGDSEPWQVTGTAFRVLMGSFLLLPGCLGFLESQSFFSYRTQSFQMSSVFPSCPNDVRLELPGSPFPVGLKDGELEECKPQDLGFNLPKSL